MSTDTEARLKADMEAARAELGFTHAEVARRLGISQPAVAKVLLRRGGLIPKSLLNVLDVLGLELVARKKPRTALKVGVDTRSK